MPESRLLAQTARFRVFAGFLFGGVVLWLSAPTARSVVTGAAVAAVGEALRIWAAGHLHKSREVTASGPYRWFAHPLYLGSSVMGAGIAIAGGRLIVVVLIAVYLGIALTVAARREEAFLRRTFGGQYDGYQRGAVDRERRFSWAQARANREHRALIGFLIAVALLALKAARNV